MNGVYDRRIYEGTHGRNLRWLLLAHRIFDIFRRLEDSHRAVGIVGTWRGQRSDAWRGNAGVYFGERVWRKDLNSRHKPAKCAARAQRKGEVMEAAVRQQHYGQSGNDRKDNALSIRDQSRGKTKGELATSVRPILNSHRPGFNSKPRYG